MKSAVFVAGILLTLAGLVWAAQGSGYFPFPASSFMINESKWIYIGLATAVAGMVLIVLSRRM
jgi:hypothetical protein